MKKSKLDTPHIKTEVVKRLAVGESQSSISKDVGLHRSQISRFANREDIKRLVEQEQIRLLDALPDAVNNTKKLVKEMNKLPKRDVNNRKLSWEASKVIMEAGGVIPTSRISHTLVNIYQQNFNQFIPPIIQELLDKRNEELNRLANQNINIQKDEE